jgi:hypothetical protein
MRIARALPRQGTARPKLYDDPTRKGKAGAAATFDGFCGRWVRSAAAAALAIVRGAIDLEARAWRRPGHRRHVSPDAIDGAGTPRRWLTDAGGRHETEAGFQRSSHQAASVQGQVSRRLCRASCDDRRARRRGRKSLFASKAIETSFGTTGIVGEVVVPPHFGRRSKELSAPGHDLLAMIWYDGLVSTSGIKPAGLASPTDPKKVYADEERNCLTPRLPGDGCRDPAWRFCCAAACLPGGRIPRRRGSRQHRGSPPSYRSRSGNRQAPRVLRAGEPRVRRVRFAQAQFFRCAQEIAGRQACICGRGPAACVNRNVAV